VSRDGLIAASAEKCHRPEIHIWDTGTCQEIIVLPVLHRKGVTCMQFSADRKLLLSVGQDDDFSIALWMSATGSWADGKIVSWTKADVNPPLFCAFYDQNQGLAGDGFLFATGGRYHQKFWKLSGKCINAHYPEYEKKVKIGTLLCGTAVGNRFVSGSTRGHLYVWNGRKLDRMIRAHELGITCIWAGDTGVVTAAKDGIVKIWTLQFEHVRSVMLSEADVPPVLGAVRSLDAFMSPDNTFISRILVTTAGTHLTHLHMALLFTYSMYPLLLPAQAARCTRSPPSRGTSHCCTRRTTKESCGAWQRTPPTPTCSPPWATTAPSASGPS
jgi:WD40 repeat protein